MKKHFAVAGLTLCLLFTMVSGAFAHNLSYDNITKLVTQYDVSPSLVVRYYNELGNWDNVDMALFISRQTNVSMNRIIHMRWRGESFSQIAFDLGMAEGAYYTPARDLALVVVAGDMPTRLSERYGISPSLALTYHSELGNWADVDRALYISNLTGVAPDMIINMHLAGRSFDRIALDDGMSAGTYFTPVSNAEIVVIG